MAKYSYTMSNPQSGEIITLQTSTFKGLVKATKRLDDFLADKEAELIAQLDEKIGKLTAAAQTNDGDTSA